VVQGPAAQDLGDGLCQRSEHLVAGGRQDELVEGDVILKPQGAKRWIEWATYRS
jgi:hypothetical protein